LRRSRIRSISALGVAALEPHGNVFVSTGIGNRAVVLKIADGEITTIYKSEGIPYLTGLGIDANGVVYAADTGNQRILALLPPDGCTPRDCQVPLGADQ